VDENTVIETPVIRGAEDAEFRWPWRSRSLSNKPSLLSVLSGMQSRMHAISAVVCGFRHMDNGEWQISQCHLLSSEFRTTRCPFWNQLNLF
jgi:hypothetical protein